MKYQHLEQIKVDLKVLTPVHIGGGDGGVLRAKLLLFNTRSWTVGVPDMTKLIAFMEARNLLPELENYLLSDQSDLYQFLKRQGITPMQAQQFLACTMPCAEQVNTVNELKLCITDSEGRPYIPGSSIKGAVRTALLASRMDEASLARLTAEATSNPKARRPSAAEHLLQTLPGDEENAMLKDIMRGVAFSDSLPFSDKDMIVCRKQWQKLDGDARPNSLYQACIRPGASTSLTLTIDHYILPEQDYPDMVQTIKTALAGWIAYNAEQYERFFPEPQSTMLKNTAGTLIRLGAGTGFQTKSLLACLAQEERKAAIDQVLGAQFRKTYAVKLNRAVAPYCRKVTCYGKALLPYGYCSLTFQP